MPNFVPPSFQKYDTGVGPKVAISGNTVVEVHQSQNLADIYYHVGQLNGSAVSFGGSTQYDDGITPDVALNASGTVVEVHQSNGLSSNMWYHVGQVNAGAQTISFGDSQKYDSGITPTVALNDSGVVVEVHQSNGGSPNLWYHVGQVNTSKKTIDFGKSQQFDTGITPSVAINNSGVVVEVHQSNGLSYNLWYHVGHVDTANQTISFGSSVNYDSGICPCITLTDDGQVIEVHQSQGFATLWRRVGQVDMATKTIVWQTVSILYGQGAAPALARSGANLVEVNQFNENGASDLMYAATTLTDHSNWMADNLSLLGPQQLQQIVIPASHDAGMYTLNHCFVGANSCNTQTQTRSLQEQLEGGSRYFDLRPIMDGGELYTGHFSGPLGCDGPTLTDLLSQVSTFMQSSRDLVILKFSHYYNRDGGDFGTSQMQTLINQVISQLQPVLYTGAVPADGLATVTLNTFIGGGKGQVLAVFDQLDSSLKQPGIYSYLDRGTGPADLVVFDEYAISNDLDGMISNQLEKLDNPANHGNSLFLLSWTLTLSGPQTVACGTYVSYLTSILGLAEGAATALYPTLQSWLAAGQISKANIPNIIYIDNSRGYATDVALWLNQQLLS